MMGGMTLNIHPLFVHFPIAFLTLYVALEVLRFPFLSRRAWYEGAKALLLFCGVAGGVLAVQTGEMAATLFTSASGRALVHMHEEVAELSLLPFHLLALASVVRLLAASAWPQRFPAWLQRPWSVIAAVERAVFVWPLRAVLAAIGFVLLVATGALGAAIVHGPDVDPAVRFIHDLLMAGA